MNAELHEATSVHGAPVTLGEARGPLPPRPAPHVSLRRAPARAVRTAARAAPSAPAAALLRRRGCPLTARAQKAEDDEFTPEEEEEAFRTNMTMAVCQMLISALQLTINIINYADHPLESAITIAVVSVSIPLAFMGLSALTHPTARYSVLTMQARLAFPPMMTRANHPRPFFRARIARNRGRVRCRRAAQVYQLYFVNRSVVSIWDYVFTVIDRNKYAHPARRLAFSTTLLVLILTLQLLNSLLVMAARALRPRRQR